MVLALARAAQRFEDGSCLRPGAVARAGSSGKSASLIASGIVPGDVVLLCHPVRTRQAGSRSARGEGGACPGTVRIRHFWQRDLPAVVDAHQATDDLVAETLDGVNVEEIRILLHPRAHGRHRPYLSRGVLGLAIGVKRLEPSVTRDNASDVLSGHHPDPVVCIDHQRCTEVSWRRTPERAVA